MSWRHHYEATVSVSEFEGREWFRLTVKRRSGRDGIGWDVLQRIKDELLGADVCAIEVYPPANAVVNEINARHLWQVPLDLLAGMPDLRRR